MYGIDTANSVATPPTPAALGTEGWFKNGALGVGDGTRVDADWLNCLLGNLLYLLDDQSIPHSKTSPFDEVTNAIASMIAEDVPAASSSIVGRTRYCTLAELQAGTLNTCAATPASLVTADESNRGLVMRATLAEALAGTEATKFVTAAALGQHHSTIGAPSHNGWLEFIGSGLMLQWMLVTTAAGFPEYRNLPTSFADQYFVPLISTPQYTGVDPPAIEAYGASQVAIYGLPGWTWWVYAAGRA